MSTAEAVAVILGAAVPLLVALASLMWWAYRRGEAAGEAKAERKAGERSLAEDKARIRALEQQLGRDRCLAAETQTSLTVAAVARARCGNEVSRRNQ